MLEDTPLLFEVDGDHDDVKAFAGLFLNNNNIAAQSLGNKKLLTHARCADAFQDTDFVVEAKMVRFDQDS